MIECSNERIYKRKRLKKPNRRLFSILTVLIIFVGVFLYYKFAVTESVYFALNSYVEQYSLESINFACNTAIGSGEEYSQFISIEKNQAGDIVLMRSNSFKINLLKSNVSLKTQSYLQNKLDKGIDIPFMAFSGLKFLSGYGKKINYKSITVSSVDSLFDGEFKSVGINQTLHSLYLKISVKVVHNMAGSGKCFEYTSKILVSEAVLVGKVPEIYLNGKLF